MSLRSFFPLLSLAPTLALSQSAVHLSPGMIVTKSIKVAANERLVLAPGPPGPCLTIRGNDITVDFNDAYVRGDRDVYHNRENFDGIGLLIDGCKNITIKNAHVQGFRFNIKVVNSQNVRLIHCDVSFSRTLRMMKDGRLIDTFLNLRDSAQWRTYGAGVWLEGCADCRVEKCFGTGALIGAVLLDTTGTTVTDCDFSFNGGWGVALSHSSDNVISWNRLDFVNRVWGGGWGGDSAGLAVANDCDRNYFVGNSMTHGGDGFFLSNLNDIGPINSQTGFYEPVGGSDHNVIAYNDGSWTPNNAFEGTFSDANVYLGNLSNGSGYGYWLGFSTNSLLFENIINDNERGGIAIEQGYGTKIEGNSMARNRPSAIHLWQSNDKARKPFPSSHIDIANNRISDSSRAYDLDSSTDVAIHGNTLVNSAVPEFPFANRPIASALGDFKRTPDWTKLQAIIATRPADFKLYSEQDLPKGPQWLLPNDYTPKDYRGSLAAQRQAAPDVIELYLLEAGVVITVPPWAEFEDTEDPYLVRIRPKADHDEGESGDRPITITLASKSGQRKQTINGNLRSLTWDLYWYRWQGLGYDDTSAWDRLWAGKAIKQEQTRQLGGDWSGKSPSDGVPADHFALVAVASLKVPPGRYRFQTLSDDGIRVRVDGRLVINRWNHHGATPDEAVLTLDDSPHKIRVEYCQEDGAAVLRLDWTKI